MKLNLLSSNYDELVDKFLFWSFSGMFFFLPLATAPAAITGGISLTIWIFSGRMIRDRKKLLQQRWVLPVLLFVSLHWIGLLWTSDYPTGLYWSKRTYYWLYAGAIASLNFDKDTMKKLGYTFLSGLSITAVIGILQSLGLFPLKGDMPTGFIGHITHTLFLVFGLLLLSFYYSNASLLKHKLYFIVLMILFIVALLVGWGRAGYLALVLLSPWIGYNLLGQKNILKITALSLGIVCLLLLSPTVRTRLTMAMSDIHAYQNMNPNTSIGWRIFMWNGACKIIMEKPWLGTGTGGYQMAMKKYETPQISDKFDMLKDPHNIFLYAGTSFGILGLLSVFWLCYILLSEGFKHRSHLTGFIILAFTLVTLIGNLSVATTLYTATGQLFALCTGLISHLDEN